MKYQKIGITGSHGTGKTTLAKKFSEELNLPFVSEVAREFDIPNLDIESYCKIQKRLLFNQIETEGEYQSFVSDRTTIDNLAYWIVLCSAHASELDNKTYVRETRMHLSTYDKIYYVPITFEIKDDNFRFVSKSFQQTVDDVIRTILLSWNIEFEKVDLAILK